MSNIMNRRERLMATLRGEPVDRPPVSFYEINGLDERPDDPDPFNIYSHPSWAPLIELAREKSDRIVMRRFFAEYVVRYDTPMVRAIQRTGGYARLHCHGRLKAILDGIAATGCDGLDPIEPPPQGDVELREVRAKYGRQMVLFGNLEASDIETLPPEEFAAKTRRALAEGTTGPGRGFVLMPSSCPYGRVLSPLALANYEKMIEIAEEWRERQTSYVMRHTS